LFNKKLKINSLPELLDKQETNVSGLQDDDSMKDSVEGGIYLRVVITITQTSEGLMNNLIYHWILQYN
jgi:hypothetical protein